MAKIREALKTDASVIAEFQQKMALETEELMLDKKTVSAGVNAVFSDRSNGFYIVATDHERVIASMLLTPEWSDWRNAQFLWIQSLFVIPEFREIGIFTKMYDFVKDLVLSSDKYAGIKLYVDQDNKIAQKAYENVGMDTSHYRLFEWNK